VCRGQSERGIAEVDSRGDVGNPWCESLVNREVGSWDAELRGVSKISGACKETYLFGAAAETRNHFAFHVKRIRGLGAGVWADD
jgi:hypothetical protein